MDFWLNPWGMAMEAVLLWPKVPWAYASLLSSPYQYMLFCQSPVQMESASLLALSYLLLPQKRMPLGPSASFSSS